jgi:hypothetical protein
MVDIVLESIDLYAHSKQLDLDHKHLLRCAILKYANKIVLCLFLHVIGLLIQQFIFTARFVDGSMSLWALN